MSIFDEVRRVISRGLIEQLVPGGEWRGEGDYWPMNPLRADNRPGSFHITENGLWKDFADDTGGDLIDLVCRMRGCPKRDAAEEIIRLGGGSVPAGRPRASKHKEKAAPVLPVPAEALAQLRSYVQSEWAVEHYGEVTRGDKYADADGRVLFCVARYEKAGKKSIRPYYWGADGKWHEGQALDLDRPVLRLSEIIEASALPVLVVEGEKCAAVKVPGYVVTTWAGGSSAVERTDWSPLAGRTITIWPDADPPGLKAALAIRRRLPHAEILRIEGRPQGWDIVDAADEGIDLAAFIRDCPRQPSADEEVEQLPFIFLGHDQNRYWFLPRKRRVPYTIEMGHFTGSQLLELAELNFWSLAQLCKDTGAIRIDAAQDWLLKRPEALQMVDLRRLRGAGVWRDGSRIVVNDGSAIVTQAGERMNYEEFYSECGMEYLPSDTRFGEMTGPESTDEEGAALHALFTSQRFARKLDPVAVLGWALIASFGGLLPWRPHLWITGRRGTGKSRIILEMLVDPLLGEFAHFATGRATEAGLRRAVNMTARPVRLDEFDVRGKADVERQARILHLARNSSSDSSACVTMAGNDGGVVQFIVRSCFCFASVNMPESDAAVESRMIRVEKQAVPDVGVEMERMARECSRVMADPARYRRRIFRALPRILSDISAIYDQLLCFLEDARETDLLAPLLCAAWAARSQQSIAGDAGHVWVGELLSDIYEVHAERVEDEDRVVQHILSAKIKTDEQRTRTVAELLVGADSLTDDSPAACDVLSRHGIKITNLENGDGTHRVLAIAISADPITNMLADTPYAGGYGSQLSRHPLQRGQKLVRLAIGVRRCRCLDWNAFLDKYLGHGEKKIEAQEQLKLGGDG